MRWKTLKPVISGVAFATLLGGAAIVLAPQEAQATDAKLGCMQWYDGCGCSWINTCTWGKSCKTGKSGDSCETS